MINYLLIAEAIQYYQGCGYQLIEVPWTVQKDVLGITCPEKYDIEDNKYLNRYLVGSAEQSFLQLVKEGKLPFGRYCAVTPCFRNEDEDALHQKYFMKIEIFHYLDSTTPEDIQKLWLEFCGFDVSYFFNFNQRIFAQTIPTEDPRSVKSYDIEINGIEVGSYGLRHHKGISWVYGTGLAEPRFSNSLKIF